MADRYILTLDLDRESVRLIASNAERIVVAKHAIAKPPQVAWLAWTPSGDETVDWEDAYGLFAADEELAIEQALRLRATVERARDRATYPFRGDAFGPPRAGSEIPARHYDVRNEATLPLSFGLVQRGSVNGVATLSPLNAAVVPPGFTADFAPLLTLSVWLQRDVEAGTIVRAPVTATAVRFDRFRRSARCRYDATTSRFVEIDPLPRSISNDA